MFFIVSTPATSQTLADLRAEREKIESDIAYRKQLLEETELASSSGLQKLSMIQSQIAQQKELMRLHASEKEAIELSIDHTENTITKIEHEKAEIYKTISAILENTYRQSFIQNRLAFVLSANSFQQAWKRLLYTQQFTKFQKGQVKQLKQNQSDLQESLDLLNKSRDEKLTLILADQKNQDDLSLSEKSEKQLLSEHERKKTELAAEVKKLEASYDVLNAEIKKLIEASIAKTSSNVTAVRSREFIALSESFEGNKGNLPWPVNQGIISRKFGKQSHPSLKNVTIQNNGIDLTLNDQTTVHTVYTGKVIATRQVPGMDHTVIIQHGEFYSVYAYMDEIAVQVNQDVSTGDVIGRTRFNPRNRIFEFHFELWSGKACVNPEVWLN